MTDLARQLLDHLEIGRKISSTDLSRIRAALGATGKRVDEVVIELGILEEQKLSELLSQFGVGTAGLFSPVVVPELSESFLRNAKALLVDLSDSSATLAMVNPWDDFTAKAVQLKLGRPVTRLFIDGAQFAATVNAAFNAQEIDEPELSGHADYSSDLEVLRDAASDAPVIRFVNETFRRAAMRKASDIHLRALKYGAQLLFRIDGVLVEQEPPPEGLLPAIISRLKIIANLDIAERRLPQDGRLRVNIGGSPVDLRISTMPHAHGEGAVLRLLSRDVAASTFEELGFSHDILVGLDRLISNSEGLLLVTGPTGSGKSTTLHVALKQLIRPGLNVVTVEDPIEYRIDGISQVQIDEKIGLTFPTVLRSLLRQDPDVVLIGEIRDSETARIAVQAALTGHVVLATLHTNSAIAAVPRLIDMGVEPYLLAAVLRGVLAQRLVRRCCSACQGKVDVASCLVCGGTGTRGRVAIGELLHLDEGVTSKLASSFDLNESFLAQLRRSGYKPMAEDAERRLAAGDIFAKDLAGIVHGF